MIKLEQVATVVSGVYRTETHRVSVVRIFIVIITTIFLILRRCQDAAVSFLVTWDLFVVVVVDSPPS